MKIPVLLMNPADKEQTTMATRKIARRTPTETANPRRRRRRRMMTTGAKARRRRRVSAMRRRRNPAVQIKPVAFGAVAGAGVAAVAYALDGLPALSNRNRALALMGGGLVGGVLLSMWSPTVGAGLAAGGLAVGGHALIGTLVAGAQAPTNETPTTTQGMGALRSQLGALRSELGALRSELGAVRELGAVYPEQQYAPAGLGAVYDYAGG